MNIASVIETVATALDTTRSRLATIPGLLLLCTCSRRPGLSSLLMATRIYTEMPENENDDILKKFIYNVADKIKKNIQEDGVCFVAIKPGELQMRLIGANAGGPCVLEGLNTNFVFVWGIIR